MENKCWPSCFSPRNESNLDISVLSEVVKDTSDIQELISFIEQRLELLTVASSMSQQDPSTSQQIAGTSQEPVVASPKMKSCVKLGKKLLDNVLKRVQKDTSERLFRIKLGDKTRKLIFNILKESVKIHWLGVGLSVLGYVLEEIDQVSANRGQCVKLLRYMCALAKQVRELDEQLPQQRQKLNDVVNFIVQGCVMCVSQMTNHSLFRFISASVEAEDIKNFESELGQKYQDLNMEAVISLLNRTPQFLPPTQGRKPDAVGIQNAHDTVTRLLQVEVNDQTRRAVVIYGFGGVGKTTLATAVLNKLKLKQYNYKFCRLDMEEPCSDNHIKLLQQQILLDLFGQNIELRSHVEGRDRLTDAFSRALTQPVFVFIDNALKKEDLAKLLPENLSCLPKQTRILLTLRKLDESSMLLEQGIQRYGYRVECLDSAASKQILCRKALGSADATFHQGVNIDGLVEICGGIPLVLNLVGSKLIEHVNDVSICNEIIDSLKESLKEGEEENISERVVDVVYNSLDQDCKEAFLDIACFFHNWKRSFVSYVIGDLPLKTLENAALVKISHDDPTPMSFRVNEDSFEWVKFVRDKDVQEGFLEVHDIVRARGRKLSKIQSERIMDVESWAKAVQDTQNLHKIKGICITGRTPKFQIDAEHLDLMHASLRIVYIERGIKINGICRKYFKNLRCIYLPFNTCFCVDMAKLKRLGVLRAGFSNNPTEFPSSLRCLELGPVSDLQLSLNESFGNLSSLQELHLKNGEVLPPNFGHLKSLRLLRFHNCEMVTLPQSFGRLSALEGLSIQGCKELESLPMGFGELENFAFLEVTFCPKLSSLSENFGQLTSLRILSLLESRMLSTLPENFGNLSSLEELSLEECSKLVSLPINFIQLKLLEKLNISFCSDLKEEAMDVLVEMKSLKYLNIGRSPMLKKRWEQAGQPKLASGCPVTVIRRTL